MINSQFLDQFINFPLYFQASDYLAYWLLDGTVLFLIGAMIGDLLNIIIIPKMQHKKSWSLEEKPYGH